MPKTITVGWIGCALAATLGSALAVRRTRPDEWRLHHAFADGSAKDGATKSGVCSAVTAGWQQYQPEWPRLAARARLHREQLRLFGRRARQPVMKPLAAP